MSKNTEATIAALEVAQPEHRLWVLKQASNRYATITLGIFCREVGPSSDELGALLLDRAVCADIARAHFSHIEVLEAVEEGRDW